MYSLHQSVRRNDDQRRTRQQFQAGVRKPPDDRLVEGSELGIYPDQVRQFSTHTVGSLR
jgi:hypothetical protein